eukprot:COSAG02_NODE_29722_length_564_cov_0.913978_1_plen_22_part_10
MWHGVVCGDHPSEVRILNTVDK